MLLLSDPVGLFLALFILQAEIKTTLWSFHVTTAYIEVYLHKLYIIYDVKMGSDLYNYWKFLNITHIRLDKL